MNEKPGTSYQLCVCANGLRGFLERFKKCENLVVVLCLGLMVTLPLVEAVLRRTVNGGISASANIVQHLCLVLGMVGGGIATREGRLLSLSTLSSFLKGGWAVVARVVSNGVGAAVSLVLCIASVQFVSQEQAGGNQIAYGIQRWWVELVMPAGFGLITLRLLWHAGDRWNERVVAMVLCLGLPLLAVWTPWSAGQMAYPALALLFMAAILGTPIFVILGGAAAILFWSRGLPLAVLPIDHYGLVMNATLPTIPLFTLAGYLLAESGAAPRLVRVCSALVGHLRGGPAIATTLACAFFTSFTGASGVTILALGGLLMPVLLSARFSERNALGLLTGAGSLGLLLPPCLPLILYAIVARVELERIFLGGIFPCVLLMVLTSLLGIAQSETTQGERPRFSLSEARKSVWAAKWELGLPFVALLGLFGGFCTSMEAAALTAFYAFVIEVFVQRDLLIFRDLPKVMTECALLVGGVLIILGVALGLTDFLVESEAPDKLLAWVQQSVQSRWVFLLVLNLFLLLVGCLMDVFSAIIVVVPLIVPLGAAFNIDPVHLGIIFLANLELGFLTPPVGMNLFLSSYRFKKPMSEVIRATLPILLVLLVGVLIITYFAPLTTWLPGLRH